jgi:hypothetical protein
MKAQKKHFEVGNIQQSNGHQAPEFPMVLISASIARERKYDGQSLHNMTR